MKTSTQIMIAFAALVVAGCAGGAGPATVAPTVDVTGKWVGTWTATRAALGSGAVEMTLKQTGSQYSGNLMITGAPTDPSGATEGVVSGNEVRILRPSSVTGSLTVQGDTMSGRIMGVIEGTATLKK